MGWNWNIFFVKKNDGNVLSKNVSRHDVLFVIYKTEELC